MSPLSQVSATCQPRPLAQRTRSGHNQIKRWQRNASRAAARVACEEDCMPRGVSCHLCKLRLTLFLAMNRAVWLASLTATAIGAYVVAPAALASGQPDAMGGMPIDGRAAVGALFTSSNGILGSHFCTASVVSSPAGNLLITAAHCLQGKHPGDVVFAPGYHNGRFPHGVWAVTTAYVDRA